MHPSNITKKNEYVALCAESHSAVEKCVHCTCGYQEYTDTSSKRHGQLRYEESHTVHHHNMRTSIVSCGCRIFAAEVLHCVQSDWGEEQNLKIGQVFAYLANMKTFWLFVLGQGEPSCHYLEYPSFSHSRFRPRIHKIGLTILGHYLPLTWCLPICMKRMPCPFRKQVLHFWQVLEAT